MRISEKYRINALACEKLAKDAKDYDMRCAWTEIAMEWHCLASRTAQETSLDRELERT